MMDAYMRRPKSEWKNQVKQSAPSKLVLSSVSFLSLVCISFVRENGKRSGRPDAIAKSHALTSLFSYLLLLVFYIPRWTQARESIPSKWPIKAGPDSHAANVLNLMHVHSSRANTYGDSA